MSLARYEEDARPGENPFRWIVRAAAERRAGYIANRDWLQMMKEITVAAEGKERAAREKQAAIDRQARRAPSYGQEGPGEEEGD